MHAIAPDRLHQITASIFAAYPVPAEEAEMIAAALVRSNLKGHDSHGVIRITEYLERLDSGDLAPEATLDVVLDAGPLIALRGNFGFGQVIGPRAMDIAIARARQHGFAIAGLSQSGHLGRIGEYPEMAAAAGFVSVHFVNTHGAGKIVAPWGGRERRMSANPFAAGVPLEGRAPLIVDISTCAIAGGKIHVAANKGVALPPGCVLDRDGALTTDPADYMEGLGAIVNFGGHKGYALGIVCDILAGALTGAGCSHPNVNRVANAMFSILIDPARFADPAAFQAETIRYIEYLKGSPLRTGFDEILYPGEPEARSESSRANAIPIDDVTWGEVLHAGRRFGLDFAGAI